MRALVESLIEAQRTRSTITEFVPPADLASAIATQEAIMRGLGETPGGWKVASNKDFGPIGAPMSASYVKEGPASWPMAPGLMLEIEVAVRLARDLPPGSYTREEIVGAIESMSVGIEVVRSRLAIGNAAPFLAFFADSLANEGYVIGKTRLPWGEFDLASRRCIALKDGAVIHDALCTYPFGEPLAPVTGFASVQKGGLGGLRAGQIVTTGSVCGVLPVTGPGRYTAEIEGFGTVDLVVEPA
jgi:2-keto-4-pentenoate hydratase